MTAAHDLSFDQGRAPIAASTRLDACTVWQHLYHEMWAGFLCAEALEYNLTVLMCHETRLWNIDVKLRSVHLESHCVLDHAAVVCLMDEDSLLIQHRIINASASAHCKFPLTFPFNSCCVESYFAPTPKTVFS